MRVSTGAVGNAAGTSMERCKELCLASTDTCYAFDFDGNDQLFKCYLHLSTSYLGQITFSLGVTHNRRRCSGGSGGSGNDLYLFI